MHIKFSFILVFFAFLVKLFAISFTNFDLFGDEAQYWAWSQNPDLGYYSKPPLLAWLITFVVYFFNSSFFVLKLIPIIIYVFTSYIIFLIANSLYKNKQLSILVAITFYLSPAVSVSSFLISTDILLILFWGLSLHCLIKIREKPSLFNFFILGIFLGLAFLSKYAAVYFYLSLGLLIILDKKTRDIFFKKKLYFLIFLLTTILVLLPNIFWNISNGWITLNHTSENAALNRANLNILQGVEFILLQFLMVGFIIFLYFLYSFKKIEIKFETKFLLCFSAPIFLIILVESILVRANANWAAVAIPPLLIFLVNHSYAHFKKIISINNIINALFCFILFSLITISSSLKVFDRINGISSFANEIKSKIELNKYLVVDDRLLYSSLRYEYRDEDIILLMPYDVGDVYKNHFQMSDPLLNTFKNNFFYLGPVEKIEYLNYDFKTKQIYSDKKLFKRTNINIYEVIF